MTQMEADFVEREAPPSYGQLIAQGLIPPVEDFPVYNSAQVVNTTHTGCKKKSLLQSALATEETLVLALFTCTVFSNLFLSHSTFITVEKNPMARIPPLFLLIMTI